MAPETETASARSDARAQRRWLIGLTITVVFGIFGAVMALLAYTNGSRGQATATPATASPRPSSPEPATSPAPAEPDGKGHGKDHGRK
jgi:hypothetical protein